MRFTSILVAAFLALGASAAPVEQEAKNNPVIVTCHSTDEYASYSKLF
jgi:hypothetical protein